MAKEILKQIKKEAKENISEILSGFFVMILMLVLSYRILTGHITQIIEYLALVISACALILVVGLEKRGKIFDKFVSMTVMFFLVLSFMFL
ncbi:MAG: hypothetical protein ACOCQX_02460 [Candidatus Nanoarchaeia archaeon]